MFGKNLNFRGNVYTILREYYDSIPREQKLAAQPHLKKWAYYDLQNPPKRSRKSFARQKDPTVNSYIKAISDGNLVMIILLLKEQHRLWN